MLILASNSPTRAKILKEFNIDFIQRGTNFDEDGICTNNPKELVYKTAFGKFETYINKYGTNEAVLCADSVVVCGDVILKKAKDEQEARHLLDLQSNSEIKILTCMLYQSKSLKLFDISSASFKFARFNQHKLEEYLKSNEWQGKAGACMIEGFCEEYILQKRGYKSTAMGLCIEKLLPFLG